MTGSLTEVSIIYQYLDDASPQPSVSSQSVSAVIGPVNHQSFRIAQESKIQKVTIWFSAVQWVSSHPAWSPKASLRSPHRAPKVSPASLPKHSKEIFFKKNITSQDKKNELPLPSPPPTMSLFPICRTACPQLLWVPLCTDHTFREM